MKMTRVPIVVLALTASLLSAGIPDGLDAQQSSWLPWIGCWEGAADVGESSEQETFLVCFQPTDDPTTVEILTYGNEGDLVANEMMFADGMSRAIEVDGCSGTRTATWSDHGIRVFLTSDMNCGTVARATTGVLSILPGGNGWVEIQAVRADADEPIIGIRSFLPAPRATLTDAGIDDPSEGRSLAIETARASAGRTFTPDALVETVQRAGPAVTSALLVERGEELGVDARTLEAMASRGVPGEVLDVMVAMSYPERFEISGGEGSAEPEVRPSETRATRSAVEQRGRGSAYGYSPWRWSYGAYRDPYRYDPYRSLWLRRAGLGYGGYGYYGGYGSYGSYYDRPRYVVIQAPTVEDRARLSRERGVVRGDGATGSGDGASQSSAPSTSRDGGDRRSRPAARPAPTRSDAPSSSGNASSGGSRGGTSNGDDVRRARPR